MTTTATTAAKGGSYTTGTVHYAKPSGPQGQLQQTCGMGRRQLAYLYPVSDDTAVTCARCLGTN